MAGLALAIFIGLFGFGDEVMHLPEENARVQLALFLSFVLGIICGNRTGK
jgi:hypothetical protein